MSCSCCISPGQCQLGQCFPPRRNPIGSMGSSGNQSSGCGGNSAAMSCGMCPCPGQCQPGRCCAEATDCKNPINSMAPTCNKPLGCADLAGLVGSQRYFTPCTSNSNGGDCGGQNQNGLSGGGGNGNCDNGGCKYGPDRNAIDITNLKNCCCPLGCSDLGCGGGVCCPPRPPPRRRPGFGEAPPLPCCKAPCDARAHHLNRSPYCCPCRPEPDPCVYRCCEGMVSSYAGHVPGFTFHSLARPYCRATFGTKNYMQDCMFYNTWSKI